MAEPQDYVLIELPRGESDVLRITRRSYEGKPYTDIRIFFNKDGEWLPTKKGLSIRDGELPQVLAALQRVANKLGTQPPAQRTRSTRPTQQRELPGARRHPQDDNAGAVSNEERLMAEELF
jgi:hypothetical protein